MKLYELKNEVEFKKIHVGGDADQNDYVLQAFSNGSHVGDVSFSTLEDEVHVNMIDVYEKRQGHGTALLKHLQSLYPATELDMGMSSVEGTALIDTLPYKKIKSQYYDQFQKLKSLKKQKKEISFVEDFSILNDLNDEIDDLEDELYDKKEFINLIDFSR